MTSETGANHCPDIIITTNQPASSSAQTLFNLTQLSLGGGGGVKCIVGDVGQSIAVKYLKFVWSLDFKLFVFVHGCTDQIVGLFLIIDFQ